MTVATRKIDTELSLTGEKEFNDQMKAVNNSLKTTRSEMAVVTAEFGKNSTKIKALTSEHKILKQTLEDQKAKEKALSDQLKAAEQAYGKNSAQAQKYRQELNQARAAVINTENALKDNTKAMLTQNAAAKALGTTFSAVAQGRVAAGSINILAKKPDDWSKGMIFCITVEFYAILSLLASFLMLNGLSF